MTRSIPARLAAFHANGADRYGVVTDDGIIDLTPRPALPGPQGRRPALWTNCSRPPKAAPPPIARRM